MKISLRLVESALLGGFFAIVTATAAAQAPGAGGSVRGPLTNGFQVRLDPASTNEEILRQDQLYVMEVTFKPMRMRWVYLTDPRTGVKKREVVWYLVYKAVNRPLDRRADTSNLRPRNVEDPVPRMMFVPEFTLVATDGGKRVAYHDVVIPEALADIRKRESKPHRRLVLKDSVNVVGPVPPVTPETAKTDNAVYGVAMWRGVDPDTDFFTVYMSGFSNAFMNRAAAERLTQPQLAEIDVGLGGKPQEAAAMKKDELLRRLFPGGAGNGIIYRKTIVQKYQRPGDRFFLTETEISRDGDPQWMYWPEDFTGGGKGKPPKSPPPAGKAGS
jgi:hypothetical protein